jgi:hypothetical protein
MLCFAGFFARSRSILIASVFAMPNKSTDDPITHRVLPSVPTSWEELQLHAWPTVTILYGDQRPPKEKARVLPDIEQRTRQVRDMLGLPEGGVREVLDVFGKQLTIDNGIVSKMLGDTYRGRVPYLRSVALAPSRAIEVWRQVAISKRTGCEAARDYYLVPTSRRPRLRRVCCDHGECAHLQLHALPVRICRRSAEARVARL